MGVSLSRVLTQLRLHLHGMPAAIAPCSREFMHWGFHYYLLQHIVYILVVTTLSVSHAC